MTLEPNRDQTDPSSRPITPPPITVKFFGTFSRERAPVDETMVFLRIIFRSHGLRVVGQGSWKDREVGNF